MSLNTQRIRLWLVGWRSIPFDHAEVSVRLQITTQHLSNVIHTLLVQLLHHVIRGQHIAPHLQSIELSVLHDGHGLSVDAVSERP